MAGKKIRACIVQPVNFVYKIGTWSEIQKAFSDRSDIEENHVLRILFFAFNIYFITYVLFCS